MMLFFKKNEKLGTILKYLLISYILTAGLLLVLAFLLYKFSLPEKVIDIAIILIYIGCTFMGGFGVGKKLKVKKYVWGLCLGGLYFLVLFLLSLIFGGNIKNISDNFFLTLIICGGSGMLGGMLG